MIDFLKQVIKYASTASIGGVIDYGLLVLLTEVFGLHYLISSMISLICAMIVQYLLNIRFVFETSEEHKVRKLIVYIIMGLIGLGMNQLIIYLVVSKLKVHYILGKVAASAIIGIYNFFSRKLYLEKT